MFIQICKFASLSLLLTMFVANAYAQTAKNMPAGDGSGSAANSNQYSDRDRRPGWEKGKQELEKALQPGHDKGWYRGELEKAGWKITSTNYDRSDYVEWEIVKGDQTYEVQLNIKDNKIAKVDVTTNMWKAKATEEALRSAMASSASRAGK